MGMDAGERGEHFIMKKKIAMLLVAALCMGTFAGCGNSTSNNSSAADNNTTNNTAAATESSDVTASADNLSLIHIQMCIRDRGKNRIYVR